jgi:hypothetical protein
MCGCSFDPRQTGLRAPGVVAPTPARSAIARASSCICHGAVTQMRPLQPAAPASSGPSSVCRWGARHGHTPASSSPGSTRLCHPHRALATSRALGPFGICTVVSMAITPSIQTEERLKDPNMSLTQSSKVHHFCRQQPIPHRFQKNTRSTARPEHETNNLLRQVPLSCALYFH